MTTPTPTPPTPKAPGGKPHLDFTKSIGPLPMWVWLAVVGSSIAFLWFRGRGNAASADVNGTPTDSLGNPITDTTGSGPGGWAYQPPPATPPAGPLITTNEQWATAAELYLMNTLNYDPGLVDAAVRAYVSGDTPTPQQWTIISQALRQLGPLPTPLPSVPGPPANTPPPSPTPNPKPKPPPPPAPKPTSFQYKLVWGDTLWGLAQRYYGNGALWPRIYNANLHNPGVKSPNLILAGATITIPK